uniref:Uncharacterized protein LOC108038852 n=1 Tax=Drosophila rhopaloa TaxID=1041015 RepID=A0A6P4E424_DRORH
MEVAPQPCNLYSLFTVSPLYVLCLASQALAAFALGFPFPLRVSVSIYNPNHSYPIELNQIESQIPGPSMFSQPVQESVATQTEPQAVPAPVCTPLLMVDEDGRKRYCYHGGKCKCATCARIRAEQAVKMDRELLSYIPHSKLQLNVPLRMAKPKQYRLEARRAAPEMAKRLQEDHERLRAEYPMYYLPDRYFSDNFYELPGPQHKQTQT